MTNIIGQSVSRKDGFAKVTGTAAYSADHQIPGVVYGYLVTASIANGRIQHIDTRAAEAASGVLAVFTHQKAPRIFTPKNNWMNSKIYEARLPLSDDRIHYAGQIIGLVVADTFERARHGAQLVNVEYATQPAIVQSKNATYQPAPPLFGEDLSFQRSSSATGDVDAALASSATRIEATYTTEMELHAPMEPHAIIAHWTSADSVKIYEHTQWVALTQRTYAELLGLPLERVRIISPYIGGGFGSKAFPWPHAVLCAAAAREIDRPLKVVVSRQQMTANTGHRSETEQTLRLGAAADGTLTAIAHHAKSCTSPVDVFPEPCTSVTPVMYATPNLKTSQDLAVMNVGTPTFMRAPGECPGMWALESAMDELAWALKIDPVQLRLKNETKEHQRKGKPFSAKHFADCLTVGMQQFGWAQRAKEPRATARDGKLIGWGMAAATFPGLRGNASAKVRLLPDGTVHVMTAGNDMGTGAYTVVAMTAAEKLGVPMEKVRVEMGDSLLPDGGLAGGSQMTASLTPAVANACEAVLASANVKTAAEAFAALTRTGQAAFEASASSAPGAEGEQYAFQSWGAHFCEVEVDEEIGRLQIARWLSVMDIGRVMNAKTAASQVRGGVIMGIGQALMEEVHFDPNVGCPVVFDLASYHFPVHADVPRIEVTFVGEPDLNFNPLGVRGVGEIGITGVAAAIANAVYHATGKRVRSLPITPDKSIG
jgi:xanthine dehydrogenase YagR molybdenum-binding subunit